MVKMQSCEKCGSKNPPMDLFRFDKDIYKPILIKPEYEEVKIKKKKRKNAKVKKDSSDDMETKIVERSTVSWRMCEESHDKQLCKNCRVKLVNQIKQDYTDKYETEFL